MPAPLVFRLAWPAPPARLAAIQPTQEGDITDGTLRPSLDDLPRAVADAAPFLAAANEARGDSYVNHEGGDVAGHSTERALVRHVANYLAAADVANQAGVDDAMLDVGSGTGGLAAWVADRLGIALHLVDRDPAIRTVAKAAFPGVEVHAELDEVARGTVGLVTAMEVLEHVAPQEHVDFLQALVRRVEPGGLLVLSTPDESDYLGGWSGYAPHVGTVTAERLRVLLVNAAGPGADVAVWRLEGDPFHLSLLRSVVQPIANRVWGLIGPRVDPLARHVVGPATKIADLSRTHVGGGLVPHVSAVAPADGHGTGLLGVVRMAKAA